MSQQASHSLFSRLPPTAAALLLAAFSGSATAGALPRQTTTIEYQELNVVSWPFLLPTAAPLLPAELLRRQDSNTICGYVDGNSALPATCSAGSHCVLDEGHGVIGCCPDSGPCTAGVYTGCVDVNSPPQTEVNPYVYTCQGSDVCYQNEFAGGFNQYGCGTASDMGTTVQTSIQGATTSLELIASSVPLTQTASSLSDPTTIGSASSTRSASSSQTSTTIKSSSTVQSTSSQTTATSSQSATTEAAAPPGPEVSDNRTAVIIGATLGSVCAIVIIFIAGFFFLKHGRNTRQGPGKAPPTAPETHYISPMGGNHGAAFAPLPGWHDDDRDYQDYAPRRSNESQLPMIPPPLQQHPAFHQQPMLGIGTGLTPVAEDREDSDFDQDERRGRQMDNYSHGYSNARAGEISSEEDPDRYAAATSVSSQTTGERGGLPSEHDETERVASPTRVRGHTPFWQQNRDQSRSRQQSRDNLWM